MMALRTPGLGDYGDAGWLISELETAKGMVARTGNVDGARRLVEMAMNNWRSANAGGTGSPDYGTVMAYYAQAVGYVETFRPGTPQLQAASARATGALPSYYGSPEQQALARQQMEAERRSLELARGNYGFMYETAPFVANPFGFASGPAPVEAATGAPRGSSVEKWASRMPGSGTSEEGQACSVLAWPLSWACAHPIGAATLVVGILAAPYIIPPLVGAAFGSYRAARAPEVLS